MSDWQEFKADAGRFFDKATKEAINLGDTAALRIRIKSTELRLDEEYSKLGRLCYKKLRLEADNAADIDAALDAAEKTEATLSAMRAELERRKRKEQKSPGYPDVVSPRTAAIRRFHIRETLSAFRRSPLQS